ncbi:MAG: thioredoxin-dependent thiol peroxidase [Rhodobiaceae bacterium]|nr:thioredoxin-dependent thiol peroxidase [Rhodobiaceae bacterium]
MAKELKEGLKAPAFSLPTDGGGKVRLADLKGQNVVLYFYPKDMTPGCTTEAIDFSGHAAAFKKANTVVVGVSKDSVERHDKFKAKHDLSVTLASDESGAMLEKYGVWQEKKLYGKVFMGIVRSTILINAEGKIVKIWPKVRVKGHADEVLEAAKAL